MAYEDSKKGDGISVVLPEMFEELDKGDDVPENIKAYAFNGVQCQSIVRVFPIEVERAMYVDDPVSVIDGIHENLRPDQGLVEVRVAETPSGARAVYSIVKTLMPSTAIQYCLTLHIVKGDSAVAVQGFFEEQGKLGARDNVGFALMQQAGKVGPDMMGWARDPYNAFFSKGVLMTLAEEESLDRVFPEHALTICRRVAAEVIDNA